MKHEHVVRWVIPVVDDSKPANMTPWHANMTRAHLWRETWVGVVGVIVLVEVFSSLVKIPKAFLHAF